MKYAALWISIALALPASSCAATPKDVRSLAQRDLACDRVEVDEIDAHRYGATGCGRGAVYARVCDDQGCRVGRLRHGHEGQVAQASGGQRVGPPPAHEVIAAPPPPAHEVITAPPPPGREVIPAPPPRGSLSAPPASSAPTPDGQAPAPGAQAPAQLGQADAALTAASDGSAAPAPVSTQPIPLSEGDLSTPYDAEVPAQPTVQRSEYPPPAPLVEQRPPPPAPTYLWTTGYWWWGPYASWTWVPGYWCAPRPGFAWVGGGWYWSTGWWWYNPGGWAYPGTTVIVQRPPPRPTRIVRVQSFNPHRSYGSAGGYGGAGVARVRPSSAPGGAVHPSPFRPSSSPLLRYPSTNGSSRIVRSSPGGDLRGASVGRIVQPGRAAPARPSIAPSRLSSSGTSFGTIRSSRVPSTSTTRVPSSGGAPRASGFGRSSAFGGMGVMRSAPARSAPSFRSGSASRGVPQGMRSAPVRSAPPMRSAPGRR